MSEAHKHWDAETPQHGLEINFKYLNTDLFNQTYSSECMILHQQSKYDQKYVFLLISFTISFGIITTNKLMTLVCPLVSLHPPFCSAFTDRSSVWCYQHTSFFHIVVALKNSWMNTQSGIFWSVWSEKHSLEDWPKKCIFWKT